MVPAPPKDEISVHVQNLSEPEVCAEKDNIDIRFSNPDIRRFKIQAIPAQLYRHAQGGSLPPGLDRL